MSLLLGFAAASAVLYFVVLLSGFGEGSVQAQHREMDRMKGTDRSADWTGFEALQLRADDAGKLPMSVTAEPAGDIGSWHVTFTLASDVDCERCSLAGDFNNWRIGANEMERGADGRWRADLVLRGGVYRYKFCVDDAGWMPDPQNEDVEDDGFESHNSILRVGALGRPDELGMEPGDGFVSTESLEHEPGRAMYLQETQPDQVRVRYRTLANDVERVELSLRGEPSIELKPIPSPAPFQYWEAEIAIPAAPTEYTFILHDGETVARDPRIHRLERSAIVSVRTPDWAKHAIWYQIFPERFRNGDPSNDPQPTREWTSDWDEPAPFEGADGQTFWEYYVYQRQYGGDLKGIEEGLDHIVDLGVTAIYLTPIFHAEGPHKYNATDFRHIDTRFGAGEDYLESTKGEDLLDPSTWVWTPSDRLFLDFIKVVKSHGLRVVLDAVFNHVGVAHPAFQDVQEKREASRFADWFEVRSWEPFEYAGWAGFGELPYFAKRDGAFQSDAVKEHLFEVTRRWMDPEGNGDPTHGIDGWRLDVPTEVPPGFWEEWRGLVKSINPEAYISAEIWTRADEWLDGRHFDAVMNYRFADPVVAWAGHKERKVSVTELDRRLLELRLAYPDEVTYALMNLVDSHDTDRLSSMLLNPDRPYDRSNTVQRNSDYDNGRPHPEHFQRARLVALLQMTYVGAPMVFYGDEVGMWGADDPTNRKPMVWKDKGEYAKPEENFWFDEQHEFYRAAMHMRRDHESLRIGSFRTLITDDEQDLWVFEREHAGERLLVALNGSESDAQFDLPETDGGHWEPIFGQGSGGHQAGDSVSVYRINGRVWRFQAPGA